MIDPVPFAIGLGLIALALWFAGILLLCRSWRWQYRFLAVVAIALGGGLMAISLSYLP